MHHGGETGEENRLLAEGGLTAFSMLAWASRVALHYHVILSSFSSVEVIDSAASLDAG